MPSAHKSSDGSLLRRGRCIPYDFFLKVSEGRVGVWVLRQLAQAWFSAIARHAHDVVLGCVLYSLSCHQELQFHQPAREKICCLDCFKCHEAWEPHGFNPQNSILGAHLGCLRAYQCRAGLVKQCSRAITVEQPLTSVIEVTQQIYRGVAVQQKKLLKPPTERWPGVELSPDWPVIQVVQEVHGVFQEGWSGLPEPPGLLCVNIQEVQKGAIALRRCPATYAQAGSIEWVIVQ